MIDTTIDSHVHTERCHHAIGTMEEYIQAAVAAGLRKIVFLEHMEAGISYFEATWLDDTDFDQYHAEGERLRVQYQDQIEIGLGVEVGYNPGHGDEIIQRLQRHTWDRIGISYHFLNIDGRYLNIVSNQDTNIRGIGRAGVSRVISAYLDGLYEAVVSLPGDVLCHLDAVARHHPDVRFNTDHLVMFNKILDVVAAQKMALEVNTSGFVHRNQAYPSQQLIKAALERHIPLVASSDAHRPQDVGRFFDRLRDLG